MVSMNYFGKLKHIYRGILPPTFNRCLTRMFTFGGYYSFKTFFANNTNLKQPIYLNFAAAISAGSLEGPSLVALIIF